MIKGKNIQLRLVKSSDLSTLYQKWHDVEIRGPFYPLSIVPEVLFLQEYHKNGFFCEDSKRFLIVDMHDNLLGSIHCAKASDYSDAVEISYILFEIKKRNKGYATEAVKLMVDHLFTHYRLNRIQLVIPVENKASLRVAEKAGFKEEGIAREAFFLNGKDVDMKIYSLLRREWQTSRI